MSIKFPRCILHIGTEKTGTSSIQSFLAANRADLLARGRFVPVSLSPRPHEMNHHRLTSHALRANRVTDDLRVHAGVRSEADVPAHRTAVEEDLRREISALERRDATLVLTNEHCHSRLVHEDEMRTLRDFLSEFAESVTILVYLRSQHELAASIYDEAMKVGYFDLELLPSYQPGRKHCVVPSYFDYAGSLDRWSAVFGRDNIVVRIYDKPEFPSGNVVLDFLSQIGTSPEGLSIPPDQNTSLAAEFQIALNAINRFLATRPERADPPARHRMIETFRALSTGPGLRPTAAEAARFLAQFADANERIRRTFRPDRATLFDPDFSKLPQSAEDAPGESDMLISALLHLAAAQ